MPVSFQDEARDLQLKMQSDLEDFKKGRISAIEVRARLEGHKLQIREMQRSVRAEGRGLNARQ